MCMPNFRDARIECPSSTHSFVPEDRGSLCIHSISIAGEKGEVGVHDDNGVFVFVGVAEMIQPRLTSSVSSRLFAVKLVVLDCGVS